MPAVDVLIVDWLGRGGIAQNSEAWRRVASEAGLSTQVATVGNRELRAEIAVDGTSRLVRHLRLVAKVVAVLEREPPRVLVIQNHVLPLIEARVHAAARKVGSKVVFVVHDDRLHTVRAGIGVGLRGLYERADVLVAHSNFVAERVGQASLVMPLPLPIGLLDAPRREPSSIARLPMALHFGIVKRNYKGTDRVKGLARLCGDRWRFCIAGVGARAVPGVEALDGFLSAGQLCGLVAESAVTLLPYRMATQSGAAVLAQALGSVALASAVGGVPEQIEHGCTGLLIAPNAPLAAWKEALEDVAEPGRRQSIAESARAAVLARHERFVNEVIGLCT